MYIINNQCGRYRSSDLHRFRESRLRKPESEPCNKTCIGPVSHIGTSRATVSGASPPHIHSYLHLVVVTYDIFD